MTRLYRSHDGSLPYTLTWHQVAACPGGRKLTRKADAPGHCLVLLFRVSQSQTNQDLLSRRGNKHRRLTLRRSRSRIKEVDGSLALCKMHPQKKYKPCVVMLDWSLSRTSPVVLLLVRLKKSCWWFEPLQGSFWLLSPDEQGMCSANTAHKHGVKHLVSHPQSPQGTRVRSRSRRQFCIKDQRSSLCQIPTHEPHLCRPPERQGPVLRTKRASTTQ